MSGRLSSKAPAFGGIVVPLKYIEHGVYGDIRKIYTKPYSIYQRRTLNCRWSGSASKTGFPYQQHGGMLLESLYTKDTFETAQNQQSQVWCTGDAPAHPSQATLAFFLQRSNTNEQTLFLVLRSPVILRSKDLKYGLPVWALDLRVHIIDLDTKP